MRIAERPLGAMVSLVSMLAMAPQVALAQDAVPQDDEVNDPIIVTATLRAEDVQDIPIAVTAVSPLQLEREGVQDIKTLSTISPSFNIQSSQTETQGTSIRIRGVGTTGNNIGLESSVGVFIDGVYQSRPGIALGDLVDLERLEILRGPQGTLFGRNTSAGALNVTTKRPNLSEVEGFANASYGNYNFFNIQGGVSVPLVLDQLGVRVSGTYRKRDGYLESSTGAESNNRDRFQLRGQALWEPSPEISFRLIGDYSEADENCCDAIVIRETELAGAFAAYGLPANGGVTNPAGIAPGIYRNEALENLRTDGDLFTNGQEQWGVSGELKWDIGAAQFTSITAYRRFEARSSQSDFVGVDAYSVGLSSFSPPQVPENGGPIKTFTQELRLQGAAFDDRLDWLIGAYYSDENITEIQALTLGPDYQAYASNALFPVLGNNFAPFGSNPLIAFTRLAQAVGPAAILGTTTGINANGSFATNRYTQEGESFSVFTHNVFSLTDELSVTLGARYVDETKKGRFEQLAASSAACNTIANGFGNIVANLTSAAFGSLDAATAQALAGGALGLTCFPFTVEANLAASAVLPLPREFDETFEDNELTYTAQLAYNNNNGLLVYGSFSHGFKSGGFNLDPAAATVAAGFDPSFGSETVDAYEFGVKSEFLDGRIRANLALYHMDLTDFQVLEFTGVQFITFNVAAAKSTGAELEIFGRFDPYITANLAVSYTDARYPDDCAVGLPASVQVAAQRLCGDKLTNAPELTGVFGITYDGPINDSGWKLLANFNMNYSDERRTSTTPVDTNGLPIPFDIQEAYFKMNARLGITSPDELFSLEVWGTNLSNEITRSITANVPLRGAAGARGRLAFIEEPRFYGVTGRLKF